MKRTLLSLTALAVTLPALAQDALLSRFAHPPAAARPRVWWHWMDGNVSKEGIHLDLEWMKRIGLGGFQMFDANLGPLGTMTGGMPLDLKSRVVFGTPEWYEHLRFAASEADRLGLEMTIHASGGWSETGGPWVKPEEGMKKLVWSELRVRGGGTQTITLPAPPSTTGPFQDIPLQGMFGPGKARGTFYRDIAVLAFPAPVGEPLPAPTVTTSAGPLADSAQLLDSDRANGLSLPAPTLEKPLWIQYDYATPQTLRAVSMVIGSASPFGGSPIPEGKIEVSDDGASFKTVARTPGPGHVSAWQRTFAFPATKARSVRVTFTKMATDPLAAMLGGAASTLSIAELAPLSAPRLHRFEDKAGFGTAQDYDELAAPRAGQGEAVAREAVRNLTGQLQPNGTLTVALPDGEWVVQRLGYSLTGKENSPANPEATGLEVDKLSATHVRSYLSGYLDPIQAALGPLLGTRGIGYVLTDSWEAGQQTWTDNFLAEFQKRRGYDAHPYLPALTGQVIASAAASDTFLGDFRRTIADLLAENHYGVIQTELKKRGLKNYGESMGANLPTVGDGLLNKRHADIPMGEFWYYPAGGNPKPEHDSDIREAASAAHVYGQNLVAAEAFTAAAPGWSIAPWNLKWLADRYLAMGVNRFIIHTSVHQPFLDRKPGVTLAIFGQYFTRNETWAEQAGPWVEYLSRGSHLLQQGRAVADVAYFYGEGGAVTAPFGKTVTPTVPQGYAFDYVGADALLNEFSVQTGQLKTRSGMRYRVLVLPDRTRQLTLPLLKKLHALVSQGATLYAPRPTGSPSLSDPMPAVARAIQALWGKPTSTGERRVGKGRVVWGKPLTSILGQPDVIASREIAWAHRTLKDTELYFIANQTDKTQRFPITFRVTGREAELWHPDTGTTEPASYQIARGVTGVPLNLDPYESVFVVFSKKARQLARILPEHAWRTVTTLGDPWEVHFPENTGAPEAIRLDRLISWTEYADTGVQHFSGTASYKTTFEAPKGRATPFLNLGEVRELAEVFVNGKPLATLWKPPFRVALTGVLQPGRNTLEVRVTNLWANRMIGDEKGVGVKHYTWATTNPYKTGKPNPLPSGLLGPVILETID